MLSYGFLFFYFFSQSVNALNKIAGGQEYVAPIDDIPGIVGFLKNENNDLKYLCAATLLSQWFALSSCSCVCNENKTLGMILRSNPENYRVKYGVKNILQDQSQVRQVHGVSKHPNCFYDAPGVYYDFGVISVNHYFDMHYGKDQTIITMRLLAPDATSFKSRIEDWITQEIQCFTIGWGDMITFHQGQARKLPSRSLNKLDVKLCSKSTCIEKFQKYYPQKNWTFLDNQICAEPMREEAYKNQAKGLCTGDSGSPLYCKGWMVGVAAWNEDCGSRGLPLVFQRLESGVEFFIGAMNPAQDKFNFSFGSIIYPSPIWLILMLFAAIFE